MKTSTYWHDTTMNSMTNDDWQDEPEYLGVGSIAQLSDDWSDEPRRPIGFVIPGAQAAACRTIAGGGFHRPGPVVRMRRRLIRRAMRGRDGS